MKNLKLKMKDSFTKLSQATVGLNLYSIEGLLVTTTHESRASFKGSLRILVNDQEDIHIEGILFPGTVASSFGESYRQAVHEKLDIRFDHKLLR